MKVEPKVYLLASTRISALEGHWFQSEGGIGEWLGDIGGSEIIRHMDGSDEEMLVEMAARRCYKSFAVGLNPNITKIRTDSAEYHANILKQLHGSVLEHATSSWAFENVSRVFTHELVRNRAGNAFSQESLRYVRLSDGINYWVPPELSDEWGEAFMAEKMELMSQWQRELADHYKIDEMKDFGRKKKLTSAFRRLAPIGLATGIVYTGNMRALRWACEQRTSAGAEYEIRLVFNRVIRRAIEEWPYIFNDFAPVSTGDSDVMEWVPQNHKV